MEFNILRTAHAWQWLALSVYGLYDTATYQEVALPTGHTGRIGSVAFSPDGHTLAVAGPWDTDTAIRLWDVGTGILLHTLTGHRGSVTSIAFGPDGQMLASGSCDNTIRLWNASTGRLPPHTLRAYIICHNHSD